MTSKQVTSPPWSSRRLVHSKEMVWVSRWSVALRAFYRQILSLLYIYIFFFLLKLPPPGSPENYLYARFYPDAGLQRTWAVRIIFSSRWMVDPWARWHWQRACFPCSTLAQVLRSCTVKEWTSGFDWEMTTKILFHSFCLEENHTLVVLLAGYWAMALQACSLFCTWSYYKPDMEVSLSMLTPSQNACNSVFRNLGLDLLSCGILRMPTSPASGSHYGSRGSVKIAHRDPPSPFLGTKLVAVEQRRIKNPLVFSEGCGSWVWQDVPCTILRKETAWSTKNVCYI